VDGGEVVERVEIQAGRHRNERVSSESVVTSFDDTSSSLVGRQRWSTSRSRSQPALIDGRCRPRGDVGPPRRRRGRSGVRPAGPRPTGPVLAVSGVVAGQVRVEEVADDDPLGLVQERCGLEGEAQGLLGRESGVGTEHEGVGAARERDRQTPQRRQRGLGAAGLVLAQLGDVHAGALGQGDLCEAAAAAQLGEGLGEGHGSTGYRGLRLDGGLYAR
jgi:hypothetical protein